MQTLELAGTGPESKDLAPGWKVSATRRNGALLLRSPLPAGRAECGLAQICSALIGRSRRYRDNAARDRGAHQCRALSEARTHMHKSSSGSIAVFAGEAGGGRRRSEGKSKSRTIRLAWKFRKSGGIPTAPTTSAATCSDWIVRLEPVINF